MTTVWHLTDPDTWADARSRGVLTGSTRGVTIAEVGFLHASHADQLALVTSVVHADVTGPMVALGIDVDLLAQHGLELREEPGGPTTRRSSPTSTAATSRWPSSPRWSR